MQVKEHEVEVLLKFYESARQEILVRITARDNTLVVYLTVVGAIIAVAFQTQKTILLLIIPFIALGITLVISNHHSIIASLALYCSVELGQAFANRNIKIAQWDSSLSRINYSKRSTLIRYLGDIIVLSVPSILTLIVTSFDFTGEPNLLLLYTFSWLCFLISSLVLIFSFNYRRKLIEERNLFVINRDRVEQTNNQEKQ